jgi:hypothetical protein
MDVTVQRLVGQLGYLFEERPELRAASAELLAERLNLEDRFARARQQYPLLSDREVAQKVEAEFPPRISVDLVREARARVSDDD